MQIINLVLDGAILIFLSFTLFYALRLTRALRTFREGKQDFSRMIGQFDLAIRQSDEALRKLREASENSGHDLQLRINQARALSEELQLVSEAAGNMADHLTRSAEWVTGNRSEEETLFRIRDKEAELEDKSGRAASPGSGSRRGQEANRGAVENSRAIQEHEARKAGEEKGDGKKKFLSQAEVELAEALRKNKWR